MDEVRGNQRFVKLAKLVVVVLILVGFTSFLLSTLSSARKAAIRGSLERGGEFSSYDAQKAGSPASTGTANFAPGNTGPVDVPLANIRSFVADIDLIPRTSVGTAKPESIYEARFKGQIAASAPDRAEVTQIQLPLPPEIISLSDLTMTVNGEPTQDLAIDGNKLVWKGRLKSQSPAEIAITYTAVGKGIYKLQPPPGRIIDTFEANLVAHQTTIRMMDLSLQPDPPQHKDGNLIYTWRFKNLMYGKPITLDVLGIAPVDQLGELSWLGPISVLVFGGLVGLMIMAYRPALADTWMLVLVVGAFAGCYPLMYFAQEFMSLSVAAVAASALVLAIIAARAGTLFGPRLGLFGIVGLAIGVLTLTLISAINANFQGVLLTIGAIGVLALTMMLLPAAQRNLLTPPGDVPRGSQPATNAVREEV